SFSSIRPFNLLVGVENGNLTAFRDRGKRHLLGSSRLRLQWRNTRMTRNGCETLGLPLVDVLKGDLTLFRAHDRARVSVAGVTLLVISAWRTTFLSNSRYTGHQKSRQ